MKRIHELDGIRGIAILLVVMCHTVTCQIPWSHFLPSDNAARFLMLGWTGVDLFFILSGFLIVGLLLDEKGRARYFRSFYARRVCRILPLYYAVTVAYLLLHRSGWIQSGWLFANLLPEWSYLTFTQNFFMHKAGWGALGLAPTWSVAVEEQFYLLIPLLVFLLNRRQLAGLFVLAIAAAPFLRHEVGTLGAYTFPHTRTDAILTGGLLAMLYRWPAAWAMVKKNARLGVLLLPLPPVAVWLLMGRQAGMGDKYLHLVLAGGFGLLVLLTLTRRFSWWSRFLQNRFLLWLGLRSYAIYLLHEPVGGVLRALLRPSPEPSFRDWGDAGITLLIFAVVAGLAELSFRFFEGPMLRLGHRYARKGY